MVDDPGDLDDLSDPADLGEAAPKATKLADPFDGAIPGRSVDCSIGKDVDAAGDLDQLRNPADAGDQRIIPLLEEHLRPSRQALRAGSGFG
jgi:hypothetical protein